MGHIGDSFYAQEKSSFILTLSAFSGALTFCLELKHNPRCMEVFVWGIYQIGESSICLRMIPVLLDSAIRLWLVARVH